MEPAGDAPVTETVPPTRRPDAAAGADSEGAGPWTGPTWLEHFLRGAADHPDATAVVDEGGSLTRSEVLGAARRLAAYLLSRGAVAGDVVTLVLPNWREFAVVHAAVGLTGCVVNPVLPTLGARDLRHVLATAGSRFVFAAGRHRSGSPAEQVRLAAADLADPPEIVVVRADDGAAGSLEGVLALPWEETVAVVPPVADASAWDTITFTSGTEALPKGVVHSHRSTMFGIDAYSRRVLGLTTEDSVFMPSPICHASGLQWGLRAAAVIGMPLVLQDRWDAATALRLIDAHGCTYTLAATPFIVDMIAARRAGAGSGASLRCLASGGAPVPRHLVVDVREELGAELLVCFGASETYVATATRPGSPDHLLMTDGVPLPGTDTRIVDELGEPLPAGTDGEIVTRGPHVFLGYLGDPELTRRSFHGSWYRFGDVGRIDENGCLRVTGRIKDIVIRGGENISAREVEDLLLTHPGVRQAAVVGYPDARLGERCCAVIVPEGPPPTLPDLVDHLTAGGLARFKLPERLRVVDAMPMTATGKIRKAELRGLLLDPVPET
ncbi:hypothetical protein GCM10009836_56610 [Pseudonocardia ailaonensis]|uniref:Cyclohexanecarboxylate-CoA ligase n=1 Tax=Pseudonocardia ailaonensis TaxID=367279 RepID=A0ABN2NHY5_9PSEU